MNDEGLHQEGAGRWWKTVISRLVPWYTVVVLATGWLLAFLYAWNHDPTAEKIGVQIEKVRTRWCIYVA